MIRTSSTSPLNLLLLYALFTISVCNANEEPVQTWEQPELLTGCERIELFVGDVNEDGGKMGLSKEGIKNVAELALRSANLYVEDNERPYPPRLVINATVVGNSFSNEVAFYKKVLDPNTGVYFVASTKHVGFTGTHGNDPDFILSSLRKAVDGFLLEYLRENERYCENKSLAPVTAIYTTDEVKHLLELLEMYHEYEIEKLKLDVISELATGATLAHWSPPKLASGQQHDARIQELERIRDARYEEVMRDLFNAMMFHGLYDEHRAEKQMEMVRKVQKLIEKQRERTTMVLIALRLGISDLIVENMTEEERKTYVENALKKYNETKGEAIDAK